MVSKFDRSYKNIGILLKDVFLFTGDREDCVVTINVCADWWAYKKTSIVPPDATYQSMAKFGGQTRHITEKCMAEDYLRYCTCPVGTNPAVDGTYFCVKIEIDPDFCVITTITPHTPTTTTVETETPYISTTTTVETTTPHVSTTSHIPTTTTVETETPHISTTTTSAQTTTPEKTTPVVTPESTVSTTSAVQTTTLVSTTVAVVTITSTPRTSTTQTCPIEDGMENPVFITNDMITTQPTMEDPSDVRDSSTSNGWVISPRSQNKPTITIRLVESEYQPVPNVQKVILDPHVNVKKVQIAGRRPPTSPGQVMDQETLVTVDPIDPSGEIYLDQLTYLVEITIIFEEPVNSSVDYEVKVGLHACFITRGKSH